MTQRPEDVALFDMDGTLCDYDKSLYEEMEKLRSPSEPETVLPRKKDSPKYLQNRADLIRSCSDWWANLPKLQLGWDVLDIARKFEFKTMILTQGPRRNPNAWKGKKLWLDQHLGEDFDITITRDKGLVYGKILVDDFPEYAERWLEWRQRGLVIMPINKMNEGYSHPQVIKYDGTNLNQVREAMLIQKNRE
jgi:5'-nucleotidase